jgi:hypothetical protein
LPFASTPVVVGQVAVPPNLGLNPPMHNVIAFRVNFSGSVAYMSLKADHVTGAAFIERCEERR